MRINKNAALILQVPVTFYLWVLLLFCIRSHSFSSSQKRSSNKGLDIQSLPIHVTRWKPSVISILSRIFLPGAYMTTTQQWSWTAIMITGLLNLNKCYNFYNTIDTSDDIWLNSSNFCFAGNISNWSLCRRLWSLECTVSMETL